MKTIESCLKDALPARKAGTADLAELVKLRLTLLVLLTEAAGFYLGAHETMNWVLLFHTLFGTSLLACGASALNQYLECDYDARMRRTQDRPLPAGRMQPEQVKAAALAACVAGAIYLDVTVNLLAGWLGAATAILYLLVYTPLKRFTWLNTLVGAIPGALPPIIGWVAARGGVGWDGWILFLLLFFWQIPHFLAIAWMHREDYARAGFQMLPGIDPTGRLTGAVAAAYCVSAVAISMLPVAAGWVGPAYLAGALILGVGFGGSACQFWFRPTLDSARQMFLVSILYLPLLLMWLVGCKVG